MPSRRRATRVAAAAPNRRIIGGAGTSVPLEVEEVPPLEVELDVELEVELAELVLELVLALVLDEVEVLVAPKLLDEISPLDVEVELPPVDVEVEPDEMLMSMLMFPLLLVPLDPVCGVGVPGGGGGGGGLGGSSWGTPPDVPPVLPVELLTTMLPPVELPPKKPPLKKPPPKPPKPLLPPTTTGTPPPLLPATTTGGGGGGGTNIGGMMVRVVVACGTGHEARVTVRRTTRRVTARRTWGRLSCFTIAGLGGGFSATWTAPPPMIAPPTVQAQSFAKAILTDIRPHPVASGRWIWRSTAITISRLGDREQMQTFDLSASALTIFLPVNA